MGGITFRYYVAPQSYLREFPHFTLGLGGETPADGYVYFISDSVREEWKPYWMYHVVVEFLEENPDSEYACLNAWRKEINAAGNLADKEYLTARCTFFGDLLVYMANNVELYSDVDIKKVNHTLEFLVQHAEGKK